MTTDVFLATQPEGRTPDRPGRRRPPDPAASGSASRRGSGPGSGPARGPACGPVRRACSRLAAAASAAGLLAARPARAVGLGGLGQNVASNLTGVAKAVQMFGFVAGLTLVVMGLMELYNTGRSHDASLKGGITKCVVGASLLAIDALISTFSTTIFGGNESSTGLGGLGL